MKKKRIITLLALLMCVQLLPTTALAATTYSIEVEQTVSGGSASIAAPEGVDGLTTVNGKVSGLTKKDQFVTVTATPAEGYVFSNWTLQRYMGSKWTTVAAATMIGNISTMGTDSAGKNCTLTSNPLKIAISSKTGANKTNLKLIPVFLEPKKLTLISADNSKGELTGTSTAIPGGEAVTLTAVPKDGCTFTGCTLAYTDGSGAVANADYTLKLGTEANTATLSLGAKVSKDVTVTAHFVDATEPNFIVPGKNLKVTSAGNATVTGWNNTDDKITVTLTSVDTSNGIMFYLKDYNTADKTYSQRVPTDVTFDFSKATDVTCTDNGDTTFVLKGDGISNLLEIPFTVTDGRNHTKQGVIRMELANRALVSSGKGTIKYNGKDYKDGEWIDFIADTDGKATIEAVGYDELNTFSVKTFYRLSEWSITGVELGENSAANPLTFTLPGKFFTITAAFGTEAKSISILPAENGSATFSDGSTTVYQQKSGTELATATTTPNSGYAFSSWKLEYEKPNMKDKDNPSWNSLVIGATQGRGNYRVAEGSTPYTNPLQIGVNGYNMRLTPVFVDKVALTAVSADTTRGTVSAPETLPIGGSVTLTATPAGESYALEEWTLTYTDGGDAVPDMAYTLMENEDGTWTLKNISIGRAITVTASFSSDKDPLFVNKEQLPAIISTGGESDSATVTITGWTNDTEEEIVVTLSKVYSDTRFYLKKDGIWLVPESVTLAIQDASGTTVEKTTTDNDVYYDLGDLTGSATLSFTVSDGREHTKQGVIELKTPGRMQVMISGGTGKCKVVCNNIEHQNQDIVVYKEFGDGSLLVTAKPEPGYHLVGWKINDKLQESTETNFSFDPPEGFFTLTAVFEKYALRASATKNGTAVSMKDNPFGITGWPITVRSFTEDMDIETAIANRLSLTYHSPTSDAKIEAGSHVLLSVDEYPGFGEYVFTSLTVDPSVSMQESSKTTSSDYYSTTHYYLFTMPESDVSITVNYKGAGYLRITAEPETEGSGSVEFSPASESGLYREGTPLQMTAVPAEGYAFKEWKEDSGSSYLTAEQKSAATLQFTVGDKGASFTAVFEEATDLQPLPISTTVDPEGKATILINGKNLTEATYGTKLTVSLDKINEYYLFDHWEITQNTSGKGDLIQESEKKSETVTFYMPKDPEGVTVKAVLKERTIPLYFQYFIDNGYNTSWPEHMTFTATVNGKAVSGTTTVKKGDVLDVTANLAEEYADQYVLEKMKVFARSGNDVTPLAEYTDIHMTYTVSDWAPSLEIRAYFTAKTEENARYNITLTQPTSGGTISSSNQTAMKDTEVTLTAVPETGYVLKEWIVKSGSEPIAVTEAADNKNQATFTMPAANVTVTAVFTSAPTLSDGSAERIDNKSATVTFTSSEAGTYFYKVVDDNATVPTVDTTGSGDTASAGSNTITLTNLTEAARDIYIVVKNASVVESAPLKVDIPAYGSSTVPDTGSFTVSVTAPKGGTLTTNRTKANNGDEIIVTVTPDSGYQMVEGSLTYSLAVAGGETVKITGNRFTMPASSVTITCKWETATVSAKGITAFTINGVSAAVNNTTNVITITLPRGTDVTKLTPVISTSGVKSLSPASGKTVDFTNSVTYTATMDDGSTKTYTVTVYVDKGSLADQFWDKLTDFYNQTPWWQYAEHQQSTKKYPKYW